MTDTPDLPLFSGIAAAESASPKRRRAAKIASLDADTPALPIREQDKFSCSPCIARVIAFPPHRDLRVVNTLLDRWIGLNKRFDMQGAYRVFAAKYESPIRQRMFELGHTPREIDAEIYRIECAIEAAQNRRRAARAAAGGAA